MDICIHVLKSDIDKAADLVQNLGRGRPRQINYGRGEMVDDWGLIIENANYSDMHWRLREILSLLGMPPYWIVGTGEDFCEQDFVGAHIDGRWAYCYSSNEDYTPMVPMDNNGFLSGKWTQSARRYLKLRKEVDVYFKMKEGTE